MHIEINKIVSDIESIQQAQQTKKTEEKIIQHLGKNFMQHIKTIYFNQNKTIIETKSIEAKTELTLLKIFNNKTTKIK